MLTRLITLSTLALAIAAPLEVRQQVVPNFPPQADLSTAQAKVKSVADAASGRQGANNHLGDYINTIVPLGNTLDALIGHDEVTAIDVLADRACIAGHAQGSLCSEIIAYAYAWTVMQEQGQTWQKLATTLGPNNMKTLQNDLNVLCFGDESNAQFGRETCQYLLEDVDVLANSLIGDSELAEDNTNSDSLKYFGLADLMPPPQAIVN